MRQTTTSSVIAGFAALLWLTACGGGGGGGGNNPPPPPPPVNVAPTANAGTGQAVNGGVTVTLNGTASSDPDGSIAGYAWTQTGGTVVPLSNATSAQPSFVSPQLTTVSLLTFSLVVTDNRGAASAASTVTVTVNPSVSHVSLTGLVRFARVPFSTTFPFGLNYANPVMQPSRGVIVQAHDATTQAVLAIGATDANGYYDLAVPASTSIVIHVMARMRRDGTHPPPRWDVRVQDGVSGSALTHGHASAPFNSSSGTQDIDIPTGIGANGVATGPRASGPFAILDTIYKGIQTVLAVEPEANFPQFYVDWGSQTDGTFFTTGNGQHIALLADLTEDTDEFDQHVVAHEFGHYVEENFSRADSIGGRHALGDRLDPRVAFGEGFGYFFAAVVLGDPVARDSFVNNGAHVSGGLNVEINPGPTAGCWCSESSVWSILWDLYDDVPDTNGNDNVSLGFGPTWQVLRGAQRTTPAFTTIFPFIEALKIAQPAQAAAINQLVAAQNINAATIDAFATTETNAPGGNLLLLPLYTTITPGVPVVVHSSNDFGRHNKAGNRRFLRFTPASSGSVTVTLATSNPNPGADPDFFVYRAGTLVQVAQLPPPQPEVRDFNVVAGQTYLIDAYDCANGCGTEEGTPGVYDLTVTIN